MSVDNEVVVRSVFILTNARLEQRSILQGRKAEGDIVAAGFQALDADCSFPRGRIKLRAAGIVGDFEASSFIAGNAIDEPFAMISPDRQLRFGEPVISGGSAKEEYVLLGGTNMIAHDFREQFSQPRPTGEHILIGLELRTVGE